MLYPWSASTSYTFAQLDKHCLNYRVSASRSMDFQARYPCHLDQTQSLASTALIRTTLKVAALRASVTYQAGIGLKTITKWRSCCFFPHAFSFWEHLPALPKSFHRSNRKIFQIHQTPRCSNPTDKPTYHTMTLRSPPVPPNSLLPVTAHLPLPSSHLCFLLPPPTSVQALPSPSSPASLSSPPSLLPSIKAV